MFFLDSLGFFSLISLLIQCGLAWTFFAFFLVLSPHSLWLRRWRVAFGGLGIALLSVSVRFALAHQHVAGPDTIAEGDLDARIYYGVYLAVKVVFVWFLVGGVAALRQRAWPTRGWVPAALVVAGFAIGAALPTVESILLVQAPGIVTGYWYAWSCLRREADEEPDIGRLVARCVFAVWAVAWVVYGITVLIVGPVHHDGSTGWNIVLRLNSVVDLTLQVSLAAALIVVVMHDAQQTALAAVRERDGLRERLQRDEKLRMMSTLVGGVAHEINNPLTAILGFADDLVSDDPAIRGPAARIVREQAERCRKITKRMSVLGQSPQLTTGPVDVPALLGRVAHGFQPQLARAGVSLDLAVDGRPCPLHADASGLEQVLTNLIANALQASPHGGRIRVSTCVTPEALHFTVADQGPGVPHADRRRIFEPFWTTKGAGEGTGLGLAVAQVLVQAHGGRIEVGDASLGGARFEVVLPWVPHGGAVVGARTSQERVPARRSAKLRLLVVDDEANVRATITRQAEQHGWAVVQAASGELALELLLAPSASFDAVVCDLRMPGMTGMGLHDELSRRAPALLRRLLFVTGDMSSAEAVAFAARSTAPILSKPFREAELFGRLQDVVSGA